uniref:Uncharacterized protein n=1 Tax=Setaria viridis TaxID=4556 RepID=A0A4U6UUJ3_SETVI|nr:hypothetical protein SEVIR_5G192700v2 [Setaria viridis]
MEADQPMANGGQKWDGHGGLGGHNDAGQACHEHGHVLGVRKGLGGPLLSGRHGLAHWVRSIVNSAMVGAHGVGASREDALQLCGRARLGLTGRSRGRAPVTRWHPHLPIQGANGDGLDVNGNASVDGPEGDEQVDEGIGANGGGGLSDTDEHVEVEPEGGTNEEGRQNGEATGANSTLRRRRRWYRLYEKQTAYTMLLERTAPGVWSRGVSEEVSVLMGIPVGTLQKW